MSPGDGGTPLRNRIRARRRLLARRPQTRSRPVHHARAIITAKETNRAEPEPESVISDLRVFRTWLSVRHPQTAQGHLRAAGLHRRAPGSEIAGASRIG